MRCPVLKSSTQYQCSVLMHGWCSVLAQTRYKSAVLTRDCGATRKPVLTARTTGTGKVKFHTLDGTAKNGAQYDAREGVVNFDPNEKSKDVYIPLIHDYEHTADLDFHVHLVQNLRYLPRHVQY